MPRPLFDSEYIFGIHEPGGERYMIEAGKPGWIVFTEELGHDPNNQGGKNFTQWSNQNLGIIARLNNGYGDAGTIPNSQQYGDFAKRCANYARNSRGCKIWIIGNEMNYDVERPPASVSRSAAPAPSAVPAPAPLPSGTPQPPIGPAPKPTTFWGRFFGSALNTISRGMGDAELYPDAENLPELGDPFGRGGPERFGALRQADADPAAAPARAAAVATRSTKEVITPQLYAQCYRLCRDAIHAVPGHEDDQVLIGAVAPWNAQTQYPGNPSGDWVQYFKDILNELGPDGCDGITIHTYTHEADPNLIYDEGKMNPPFQNYHYQFRTYRDFMNAVPIAMRHLPVYITETDQDVAWLNRNIAWVQRAYGEIDYWNKQAGNQQIRALILYRWPQIDKWYIEGKQGVIDDFKQALRFDYKWRVVLPAALTFRTGNRIRTLDIVNLRRSAGYTNKPIGDLLAQIPQDAVLEVLDGQSVNKDGLVWWNVRAKDASNKTVDGWLSQFSPTGIPLMERTTQGLTTIGQITGGESTITPATPTTPATITPVTTKPATPTSGPTARTLDIVRMRRTPGFRNKGIGDVIGDIPLGTTLNILGGPNQVDDLTWWEVTGKDGQGATVRGWMAEALPDGTRLLDISNVGVPTGGEPPAATSTPGQFALGDKLHTLDIVRLRRTPGFNNKPATDVVADVAKDVTATVIGGPIQADGLTWWQVNSTAPTGGAVSGWMAESVSGKALLAKGAADDASRGETGKFSAGQQLRTLDIVRMRKTPGFFGKLTSDIVWDVPKDRTLKVLGGPQKADGLTWWNVEVKNDQGQTLKGWMAESLANGILLLEITSGSTAGGSGPTTPTPTTGNARFAAGNSFKTVDIVRMRRTPGYFDKPSTDIVADIPTGTAGKILGGPQSEDDLIWWNVETTGSAGQKLTGWMAQDGPNGIALIQKVDGSTTPPPPVKTGAFETGELVVTADAVNVRKTAGYLNKPGDDVLGGFRTGTTLNIVDGPQDKDSLTWWRAGGITPDGPDGERIGWVAEAVGGNQVLIDAPKLPGTNIPDKPAHIYLGPPTDRVFAIGQLWGENPQFYKQFKPGGVPLLGHNGIDFFTPTGSNLISVDAGTILDVGNDPGGFGIYVVVGHSWGQSIYAHMSRAAVQNGQSIGRGGGLGKSGNTGASTGPHLHFAIRINPFRVNDGWGGFSDPLPYLPPESIILPPYVQPTASRSALPIPAGAPAPAGTPVPTDVAVPFQRIAPSGITEEIR